MSNFSATEFQALSEKSEKIFNSMLESIKAIKNECKTLGDIVNSDDSSLGSRWVNVNSALGKPITNINDTFLIIKALLKKYIEDTVANEQQAAQELEEFDTSFNSLAADADEMISGLTALQGIGFGASAIAIPGVTSWASGSGVDDIEIVNPTINVNPATIIEKYGPPSSFEPVTKYAPPSGINVIEKYGPPCSFEPVTKYAPPSGINVIEKYAAPSAFEVVHKYGPPSMPGVTNNMYDADGNISNQLFVGTNVVKEYPVKDSFIEKGVSTGNDKS